MATFPIYKSRECGWRERCVTCESTCQQKNLVEWSKSGHCSHMLVKRQGSVGGGRSVSLVEVHVGCKKVYVLV